MAFQTVDSEICLTLIFYRLVASLPHFAYDFSRKICSILLTDQISLCGWLPLPLEIFGNMYSNYFLLSL